MKKLLPSTPLSDFIIKQLHQNGEEKGAWLYPGLCLASCQATGGSVQQALPAATALRLVYEFEQLWTKIARGIVAPAALAQTINAGDALLALAHLSLLRSPARASRLLIAEHLLNRACLKLCQGHHLEKTAPQPASATRRIASCKAALFQACFGLGAIFSPQVRRPGQIANFGRLLGLAFYLRGSGSSQKAYALALDRVQSSTLPPAAKKELQEIAAWLLSGET